MSVAAFYDNQMPNYYFIPKNLGCSNNQEIKPELMWDIFGAYRNYTKIPGIQNTLRWDSIPVFLHSHSSYWQFLFLLPLYMVISLNSYKILFVYIWEMILYSPGNRSQLVFNVNFGSLYAAMPVLFLLIADRYFRTIISPGVARVFPTIQLVFQWHV